MLSIQRWSPDTCGCTLYQIHDPESTVEKGKTPQFVSLEDAEAVLQARRDNGIPTIDDPLEPPRVCPDHAAMPIEGVEHHDACIAESQMKNRVTAQVADLVSADVHDVVWAFNAQRELTVAHPDLDAMRRTALAVELAQYGGKASVAANVEDVVVAQAEALLRTNAR